MMKEEVEEQFNRGQTRMEICCGRGKDHSEDRKHTSGEVFVAVDSNLVSISGKEGGALESIPGNEGRIAQAWVSVRGGLRVFSVDFWHSEGWTRKHEASMEAVVKQVGTTRLPKHVFGTCWEKFWVFKSDKCSSRYQRKSFQLADQNVQMSS